MIPILRAVPATIRIADSRVKQFRSGILSSAIALTCNLFLLVAILSMLQATLTLPGIAAMALTLGMAVDANVLINAVSYTHLTLPTTSRV